MTYMAMAGDITASGTAYNSGFGNEFATEALPGALPHGRNSPQRPPLGLYAEQFSTSAFTVPRADARRTWMYRIRPSAAHGVFNRIDKGDLAGPLAAPDPNRQRWNPFPVPAAETDFVAGLATIVATAPSEAATGVSVHVYRANKSMTRVFYNADGEMLIVPQAGGLNIATECGRLQVQPGEIVVVPRGIKFRVELLGPAATGYICENHGAPLRLPDLGPIGSNGLANPRDFLTPVAWFEDRDEPTELVQKFQGELWSAMLDRQQRALQVRPVAVQHDRHGQLRPPRPLDLHGPDLAHDPGGRGQRRLRHLPAPLDGRGGHLPAALVPPQRDERVHGPDLGRL